MILTRMHFLAKAIKQLITKIINKVKDCEPHLDFISPTSSRRRQLKLSTYKTHPIKGCSIFIARPSIHKTLPWEGSLGLGFDMMFIDLEGILLNHTS